MPDNIAKEKDKKIDNTPEQNAAIMHDKGDILVSASAGSGKTYVMIQRLIRLILDGKADINEVLAVTFTKLAASEMKEKLIAAVTEKINTEKDPEKAARLRKQLADIPGASISTFHSFCADLMRSYFYEIGLDAAFAVAEETDAKIIADRAVREVFAERYAAKDPELLYLLSVYASKRRDDELMKYVTKTYDFFASEAYPERFAQMAASVYTHEGYRRIKAAYFAHYRDIFAKLGADIAAIGVQLSAAGLAKPASSCTLLKEFADSLVSSEDLFDMARRAQGFSHRLPDMAEGDFKKRLGTVKKNLSDTAKELASLYALSTDAEEETRLLAASRSVNALIGLTQAFGKRYGELKKEANVVDFNDLEHYALALLDKPAVLAEVKARYTYIFADEYQDTNGVQEEILSKIARNNSFMVGDVKQSIYAFRGCKPEIFENKARLIAKNGGEHIRLSANFRCADKVLQCVNNIFGEIMTEDVCGEDYAGSPMTGGNGTEGEAALHIIAKGKRETAEVCEKKGVYSVKDNIAGNLEKKVLAEGMLISKIIRDTMDHPVTLKDGTVRKLGYGDIAVLTRNKTSFATRLVEAISANGIPLTADIKKSILEYPEVKHLVALCRLVDNGRQDIPLLAVMRGPTGGFSDRELACIRTFFEKNSGDERGSFASAVRYFAENAEGELKDKTREFLAYVEKLRFLSDYEGAGAMMTRAITDRRIDMYYAAKKDGKNRLNRINTLVHVATPGGRRLTVKEFLDRIDRLSEELASPVAAGETVRLMSIHSSKGLEFPVVIVAGLGEAFNRKALQKPLIYDREYGIAVNTYDNSDMTVGSNIFRNFVVMRYGKNSVKEEERILYVALTRAQYRLYMTAVGSPPRGELGASDIINAKSFSDLISQDKVETVMHTEEELSGALVSKTAQSVLAARPDDKLCETLKHNLSFVYPYDTALAAKSSVTAAVRDGEETVPAVFSDDESARLRGNAYHQFMQLADYEKSSVSQLNAQKQAFIGSLAMTAAEGETVDVSVVQPILSDPFFHIAGAEYFRELPFEVYVPGRLVGKPTDEEMLLQGIIDVIAFVGDEIYIADYKVSGKSPEHLVAAYRSQLDLYSYAAEKITGKKVKGRFLFNLQRGYKVEV